MTNVYSFFSTRFRDDAPFLLTPCEDDQPNVLATYGDLAKRSAQYANLLRDMGIGRGDRISVQVDKSAECLFLYFGCLRAGATWLPLNTAYRTDEVAYFVGNARPSLSVCRPGDEGLYGEIGAERVVAMASDGGSQLKEASLNASDAPFVDAVADDDLAVILYTSGTTGNPKGAMISHGNLAANAAVLHKAWQWQPADIMLHALPIFHIHGLFVATHLPVLNGTPIIFVPAFDPDQVIDNLPQSSVYMGVPTNYVRLLASDRLTNDTCASMRLFTCGSAPLLPQTFDAWTARTGHEIVERYGMTETGMNTSNPVDGTRKPGTVGLPLPGVSTRIVDDSGQIVAPGETGNLQVSGTNVFRGYWEMPEKTAEDFTADGWFNTGDLASCDDDGYIAIVGRNKDMIISGGLNVYPKEIESVIDDLPGVIESAVIGTPHAEFGEAVTAVIVSDPETPSTAIDIIDAVKARLANFKVPKAVHFVDALPRNTMGKVQKKVLRDRYNDA